MTGIYTTMYSFLEPEGGQQITNIKVGHGALLPQQGDMAVVTDGWWSQRHIGEGKGYKKRKVKEYRKHSTYRKRRHHPPVLFLQHLKRH